MGVQVDREFDSRWGSVGPPGRGVWSDVSWSPWTPSLEVILCDRAGASTPAPLDLTSILLFVDLRESPLCRDVIHGFRRHLGDPVEMLALGDKWRRHFEGCSDRA